MASVQLSLDGGIGMAASGLWHLDGSNRKATSGRWYHVFLISKKIFVTYHVCLSFFAAYLKKTKFCHIFVPHNFICNNKVLMAV